MLELVVLKELLNKPTFLEYGASVPADSPEMKFSLRLLEKWFKDHNNPLSVDELEALGLSQLSSKKERDSYHEFIEAVRGASAGEQVVESLLAEIKQRQIALQLSLSALELSEGRGSREAFDELYKQYGVPIDDSRKESLVVTDSLEELVDAEVTEAGLPFRLKSLARALGSLRRGDFGFIFARPETGKTTLLASEATFMAAFCRERDLGPVLWFNNEERGRKVKLRIYQAYFGVTLVELLGNIKEYQQRYLTEMGGRIILYDSATIHRREVERECKDRRPALVIVDQLDKIKGFDGDREDLRLGGIYQWARELAKEYCPVIAASQANGQGEGVKWLTMDHVSNAQTAKQAEADFILGIGKTHDPDLERIRHINISKNKLMGDANTDESMRHGRIDVRIKPEICRYEDIL